MEKSRATETGAQASNIVYKAYEVLNKIGLSPKWKPIGRALGLPVDKLEQIQSQYAEEKRLLQVLIQRQLNKGKLQWEDIAPALEDNGVGEDRWALMLRMKLKYETTSTTNSDPYEATINSGPYDLGPPQQKRPRLDENKQTYPLETFIRPDNVDKYRCMHCRLVPVRAYRPECVHSNSTMACEGCKSQICSIEGCNHVYSKYDAKITANIKSLKVYCQNKEAGCNETMALSAMKEHLKTCPMQQIPCVYAHLGCTEMVRRIDINDHTASATSTHFAQAAETIATLTKELREWKKATLIAPVYFKIGPIGRGRKKWMLSEGPAFYSHQDGYKLQLKMGVQVNTIKTTSQFNTIVCTLPGDNDDSLVWPVTGTLTITLLNQTKNPGHSVARLEFTLRRNSQTEIFETTFHPSNEYITNDGEGELHFCVQSVELKECCKPWLLDPTTIINSTV